MLVKIRLNKCCVRVRLTIRFYIKIVISVRFILIQEHISMFADELANMRLNNLLARKMFATCYLMLS